MNSFGMKPCLMSILVLGGAGVFAFSRVPADRESIDQRIDKLQPTRKEKRFDEIGWVKGLPQGERLSRKSGRPLFLFSNVGDLDIGRC